MSKTEKIVLDEVILSIMDTLSKETYLVGGYVRDRLFERESDDLDFATLARLDELKALYPDGLFFEKFSTVSFKKEGRKITIATFRKEDEYIDHRHPSNVEYIDDYRIDALRRDFTINALYADRSGVIHDPTGQGIDDINYRFLRMIGNADKRIKEDPLRILRAYRFCSEFNLTMDEELHKAIYANSGLLDLLNPNKVHEELKKFDKNALILLEEELGFRPI